jgi:hypothetical protein
MEQLGAGRGRVAGWRGMGKVTFLGRQSCQVGRGSCRQVGRRNWARTSGGNESEHSAEFVLLTRIVPLLPSLPQQ